jgi:hypothetical protein
MHRLPTSSLFGRKSGAGERGEGRDELCHDHEAHRTSDPSLADDLPETQEHDDTENGQNAQIGASAKVQNSESPHPKTASRPALHCLERLPCAERPTGTFTG